MAGSGIVLTLIFFFSGFFVLLTPVPLIYHFLRRKGAAFLEVVLPCFFLLGLLYFFGLGPLSRLYQNDPRLSWFLPIPAMNLLPVYGLFATAWMGLLNFLFFVIVALFVAGGLVREKRLPYFIGGGALFFTGMTAILLVGYAFHQHQSPLLLLQGYYQEEVKNYFTLNEAAGFSSDTLVALKENIPLLTHYLVVLSPSLFCVLFLIILLLNLMVGRKFLAPFFSPLRAVSLTQWDLSFIWVWGVIFLVVLWLSNSLFWHQTLLMAISTNGLIVLFFAYFLKGLSLLAFLMDYKQIGPFFRFALYALIFILFQTLGFLVTGFGFFDSWFNLRGRIRKK